jgi:hypothetical protein
MYGTKIEKRPVNLPHYMRRCSPQTELTVIGIHIFVMTSLLPLKFVIKHARG